jgi:hypothetical protein
MCRRGRVTHYRRLRFITGHRTHHDLQRWELGLLSGLFLTDNKAYTTTLLHHWRMQVVEALGKAPAGI